MTAATGTRDTTPLYKPADVADVAARHQLAPTGLHAGGAWTEWTGRAPDGRTVLVSTTGPGRIGFRATVAVGATDDADDWQAALDYATPAWVLDELLTALLGETTAAVTS